MLENTYRDENGLLWYKPRFNDLRLKPGAEMFWVKSTREDSVTVLVNVPVTFIEYRGAWAIVEAADGKHRVRPHNLHLHPDRFAWSEE